VGEEAEIYPEGKDKIIIEKIVNVIDVDFFIKNLYPAS